VGDEPWPHPRAHVVQAEVACAVNGAMESE
jgi:hypothetical protein